MRNPRNRNRRGLASVLPLAAVLLFAAGCGRNRPEVAEPQPPKPPPQWGYGPDNGPSMWAGLRPQYALCGSGTRQSPVDLATAISKDLPDVTFVYRPAPLVVFHHRNTVGAELAPGNFMEVGGSMFDVAEIHFHAPSEHTVAGKHYPAEMHLVHRDGLGNMAVVGVFLTEGAENPAFQPLLDNLPPEVADGSTPVPGASLDLAALLPEDHQDTRYLGSLTTPPCTERVRWYVLRTPVALSATQLDRLRSFVDGTNRPVQELHGRLLEMDLPDEN